MQFDKLLSHLDQVELEESDLDQVITFNKEGKEVTLGDLVSQSKSSPVLAAFGRSSKPSPVAKEIKAVTELDDEEVQSVVYAQIDAIPEDQAIAVTGWGSYTANQLRHEVETGTELGRRFTEIVKQHNVFLEEAVKRGKIKQKSETGVKIPDFDF
jgi:hypothetical protein